MIGVESGSSGEGVHVDLLMIEGRKGMFVVETIALTRRAHCVHAKLIKAICRELRVSRKTVRNMIRLKATEFHCERNDHGTRVINK